MIAWIGKAASALAGLALVGLFQLIVLGGLFFGYLLGIKRLLEAAGFGGDVPLIAGIAGAFVLMIPTLMWLERIARRHGKAWLFEWLPF